MHPFKSYFLGNNSDGSYIIKDSDFDMSNDPINENI